MGVGVLMADINLVTLQLRTLAFFLLAMSLHLSLLSVYGYNMVPFESLDMIHTLLTLDMKHVLRLLLDCSKLVDLLPLMRIVELPVLLLELGLHLICLFLLLF